MEYTPAILDDTVERFGEVFVVLDSGREYEIHGKESYTYTDNEEIRVEGIHNDEYVIVEFPLDAIEHTYTHKQV